MGEGHVSAGVGALIAALACLPLPGQGVLYRERWGYLHLENRRFEVLRELRPAAPERQQEVARLLGGPDAGPPFVAISRALAALRGTAADDAFVLRAAMSVFVLPEVADPDGRNEACRVTSVSAFLPCSLSLPKQLAIEFEVRDRAGKPVWNGRLDGAMPLEDLRMARPAVEVPCGGFADGTYELTVRTIVDGKAPGPKDPVLRWPMHVQRGFQARSEAAIAAAREAGPKLAETPRALLTGLASLVWNAYSGEAFVGTSRAVDDLARLELALQNLRDRKHVLTGLWGDVATALPTGEPALPCVLRFPAPFGGERESRPLVLFAAAVPCYDAATQRPGGPGTRGPLWQAMEMATFGERAGCDVAFLDSPGEGRDYARHLARAIAACKELFGTGDRPVVLVCDREAASVVGLHIDSVRAQLAGLVLVGSGGMTAKALDALGPLPVRLVSLLGHPGGDGLQRALDYVNAQDEARRRDVRWLVEPQQAWSFGVPLVATAIESFAADVFRR